MARKCKAMQGDALHCLVDRCQRLEIKNINSSHQIASKWEKIRHGISQGSILRPLFFVHCINYIQNFIKNESIPIPFADDTSIIVIKSNSTNFISDMITIFEYLNKWFRSSSLSLNLGNAIP